MNRTILAAALAACLAGVTAAAAPKSENSETTILRNLAASPNAADREKAAGLAAVEQENARLHRSKNLSAQEIQTIAEEKSAGHAKRSAELSRHTASQQPAAASPFHGVIDGNDVPNPFRADELTILNFWGGERNGKPIGVYSGYLPEDPSRGVLVVFDDRNNTRGTRYELPAGPMAIASEADGTLILQSRGNELRFDLASRRFD